jgi:CRP-like cAMP-binding protein
LIIKEGAAGDEMYVIDRGEFTVHKKDDSGVSQLVFTYTQPGAAFGELSLMYGKPRAASVKAKTGGRLWSIGRQVSPKACDSF